MGISSPSEMLRWFLSHSISVERAKTLTRDELVGKITIGEFIDTEQPELAEEYRSATSGSKAQARRRLMKVAENEEAGRQRKFSTRSGCRTTNSRQAIGCCFVCQARLLNALPE